METRSTQSADRLAKISRILGLLSIAFIAEAFGLWFWVTFISRPNDDASLLALGFWIVIFFLGGLASGIVGVITAIIALQKNSQGGNDPIVTRIAKVAMRLSILSVAVVVILFSYILLFPRQIPPPDTTTPIPSTAIQ